MSAVVIANKKINFFKSVFKKIVLCSSSLLRLLTFKPNYAILYECLLSAPIQAPDKEEYCKIQTSKGTFFEISPSEKSCASINSNVLNRETHYFRIAHSSRLQSAELAASEDEKNKIGKSSREMTDHLEAQIRQLKSQIEKLESMVNNFQLN